MLETQTPSTLFQLYLSKFSTVASFTSQSKQTKMLTHLNPIKGTMNSAFSVPFFSLNMSAQPRKYGSPQKKLSPRPLRGFYGPLSYCLFSRAKV